jgi:hypothetical protein
MSNSCKWTPDPVEPSIILDRRLFFLWWTLWPAVGSKNESPGQGGSTGASLNQKG